MKISIGFWIVAIFALLSQSAETQTIQSPTASSDSVTALPTATLSSSSPVATNSPPTIDPLSTSLATGGGTTTASSQKPPSSSSLSHAVTSATTTLNPSVIYISYANATTQDVIYKTGSWNASILIKYNVYSPDMGTDIAFRSSAITLTLVSGFIFLTGFAKRNLIAWLVSITLFGHAFAVWAGSVPFLRIVPSPNIYWTNFVSVTLLCFTSETFLWCLYIRFTAVVAMRSPYLKYFTLVWLTAESLMVLTNTVIWNYYAYTGNSAGKSQSATQYSYMNFVQATTAAFLSGYFFVVFYIPKLRGLSTWVMVAKLYSTGLIYLFGEVTLHLMYFVAWKSNTTQPFYTGFSAFCTSVRLALFVLFLFKMKDTIVAAEKDRESQRNKTHPSASNPGISNLSSHSTNSGIRMNAIQPQIIPYKNPTVLTDSLTDHEDDQHPQLSRSKSGSRRSYANDTRRGSDTIPLHTVSTPHAFTTRGSNQIQDFSYEDNTADLEQISSAPQRTRAPPTQAFSPTSIHRHDSVPHPIITSAVGYNPAINSSNTHLLYQGPQSGNGYYSAPGSAAAHPSWNQNGQVEANARMTSPRTPSRAQTISEPVPMHSTYQQQSVVALTKLRDQY